MKKIIEFFKSLFGSKWEYVPTEYAKPSEALVDAQIERVRKLHVHPKALAQTPVKKTATKKAEPKKSPLQKMETKKPATKTTKKKK